MTQDELLACLEKDCGMRVLGKINGFVTLELRVMTFTLPPPLNNGAFTQSEIQHILETWCLNCEEDVYLKFENGSFIEH